MATIKTVCSDGGGGSGSGGGGGGKAVDGKAIDEGIAAKIESLGYNVGVRLLGCNMNNFSEPVGSAGGNPGGNPGGNSDEPDASLARHSSTLPSPPPPPSIVVSHSLTLIKYLCKEIWSDCFQHQITKLQTNHRGIFVLRDTHFVLLKGVSGDSASITPKSRIAAIKTLAFPCGLIRGFLSAAGYADVVVSCDFCSDGGSVDNCCFNVKIGQ
jgi:hypothetical protein